MADYKKKDGNVYQLNRRIEEDIPDRSRMRLRDIINPHPFRGIDYTVLIIVLILVMFGLVMVFSSSYYYAMTEPKFNDKFYFFSRQLRWAIVGLVAMVMCMSINTEFFRRVSVLAYVAIIGILVAVLAIGVATKGSQRWLEILGTSFQPSEFAKFIIIIFMSGFVIKHRNLLNGNFIMFIKCALPVIVAAGLIAMENLSTGIVVMVVGLMIMFVSSKKVMNFVVFVVVGFIGFVIMVAIEPYRRARIMGWLDPWSDTIDNGYQIVQSLFAVASGGLFGLGIGQSRQKTFIPESYNDIIFAIICEELGLVGAIVVILLFLILIWRGIKIAMNARDKYSSYAATGIITMIAVQVIINIAVVTNTMPNTGMPMPFISYGGTSLVVTMASMGLLLNISRNCRK
ncbi:MAG TPA: putative lipid II flippase FtsW [Firmicutes bacterium]|nr:putative lipid II flippase FtsW [Bacillota bacterium]